MSVEQVVSDMRFDADEMLVLALLQQVMVDRDLIAEKDAVQGALKQRFRDEVAVAAHVVQWLCPDSLPPWARAHAPAIAACVPAHQRAAIEAAEVEVAPVRPAVSKLCFWSSLRVSVQAWGQHRAELPKAVARGVHAPQRLYS